MLAELPTSLVTPDAEPTSSSTACPHQTPAPALITVHQVAFSTAAAAPTAPTLRRWLRITPMPRVRGVLTALVQPRPDRPHREPTYFQTARMSRAMERL
jgi:hypothetical protein